MRVFVTGSTGFLGFAIVTELMKAGHKVTGLARSRGSAEKLIAAGAEVLQGDIEDLQVLRKGAAAAEGVLHTAFYHQISHIPLGTRLKVILGGLPSGIVFRFMVASVGADRRALETMGEVLKRTGGPLVAAFPTMSMEPAALAVETETPSTRSAGAFRGSTEIVLRALASQVRTSIIRLPPVVHGEEDRNGLLPQLIKIARKKRESGYVGGGHNRWAAVHKLDAAVLFRLALERGTAGSAYHAVAEQGIPFKQIAEAIATELGLPAIAKSPADVARQFGFLSPFVEVDNPVSSDLTRHRLNWDPTHPGTFADLPWTYFGRRVSQTSGTPTDGSRSVS